jgi:3-phenylpropionate/trans-cinnamate dioxygenase ferredoxin subunit
MRRVELGGVPICLVHAEDGTFFAVADTCSHEDASLSEGWTYDKQIECPRHNSIFDLTTGEPTSLPAVDPIDVYAVSTDGEDLLVSASPINVQGS